MTLFPSRSSTLVSRPASRRIRALAPTALKRPPRMATASAMENAGSTVTIFAFKVMRSGGGSCVQPMDAANASATHAGRMRIMRSSYKGSRRRVFREDAMIRKMAVAGVAIMLMAPIARQRGAISSRPDTLFKLATVEAGGKLRLAMSVAERTIDIAAANASLSRDLGLPVVTIPGEMRELIEQYDRVAPRLYQIAN